MVHLVAWIACYHWTAKVPDKFGFDHLGAEVRCIEPGCGAGGTKGKWSFEQRQAHHRNHHRPTHGTVPTPSQGGTTTMSTASGYGGPAACIAALRAAGKPLSASEIAAIVVDAGVVPGLKGKTPTATLGATVYSNAAKGTIYKRVGTGRPQKFDLRTDAPDSDPQLVETLKKQIAKAAAKAESAKAAESDGKPAAAKAAASAPAAAKTAAVKSGTKAKPDPKPAKKKRTARSSARSAVSS